MSTPYDTPRSTPRHPLRAAAQGSHRRRSSAVRAGAPPRAERLGVRGPGAARNGVEAVELAARERPDVVLMDIHMPVLDGIRATRRVRAISPGTRVVAITSDDAPAISAAARDAGASMVLIKTCAPDDLLDAVSRTAAEVLPFRLPGAA